MLDKNFVLWYNKFMRTINNFEELYITADLHLSNGHLNRTIRQRGFTDVQEHTTFIRNLINKTIRNKSAILYVIGDIGFREDDESLVNFIKSLTPRIKVAYGNHDSQRQLIRLWKDGVFEDVKHEYFFRWRNNTFHLHHLPLVEWEGFYENGYLCFGHTHGSLDPYLRAMDIGLGIEDMKIYNLENVVELRNEFHNIDDNGNRLKMC